MEPIRNIQLIPTHDPAYQMFLKNRIAFKRKKFQQPQKATAPIPASVTAPTVPNPQWLTQQLSRQAEWLVRQWLGSSVGVHNDRILSYEKYNPTQQEYIRQYRELDAISLEVATNTWIVTEVKLSRNPQAVATAVQQVSQSSQVLETAGWQTSPLVVWLNYSPSEANHPYPIKPFHPDFFRVPRSNLNQVSILSICPKSLFQWGAYKGWVSPRVLKSMVANWPNG
ncbi:hypothetical protein [Larkinella harenae]